MEPFLADFLRNRKVPRWIRTVLLSVILSGLEFVCLYAGLHSPFLSGRIICFGIAGLILTGGVYVLLFRIWTDYAEQERGKKEDGKE